MVVIGAVRDRSPIVSHRLADVLLVLLGLVLASAAGADFHLGLIVEFPVLSFVCAHNLIRRFRACSTR